MAAPSFNKYRAAIEVLNRGRDVLVEGLADDILNQQEDLSEGGYQFNEYLEGQGTRLHFLSLLVTQLEQSAEALESEQAVAAESEPEAEPQAEATSRRRPRSKKMQEQAPKQERSDEF